MSKVANPARGDVVFEADGQKLILRPTFQSIVAAEAEVGSIVTLAAAAAEGRVQLEQVVRLFAACAIPIDGTSACSEEWIGDLVMAAGINRTLVAYHALLSAILRGQSTNQAEHDSLGKPKA